MPGHPGPSGWHLPVSYPHVRVQQSPLLLSLRHPPAPQTTGLPTTANTRKAHERRTFVRLPLSYRLFRDPKSGYGFFFFFLTCYLEEREQHEWEAFSNRQR